MKKLLFTLITVSLLFIGAFAGENKSRWDLFSKNIEHALQCDNPGARLGTLKLIIRHHQQLHDTIHFNIVLNAFNTCKEPQIRKAALLALYKLNSTKAVEFFKLQGDSEENPAIRTKMAVIVLAFQKSSALADIEIDSCFNVCRCCSFVSLTF